MKHSRSQPDWSSEDDCWWRPNRSKAYLKESVLPVNLYIVILFLAWLICGLIWTIYG